MGRFHDIRTILPFATSSESTTQEGGGLASRLGEYITSRFTNDKDENALHRTETRQSAADRIPNTIRNHLIAMTGEFVGTFLFLFFALSGTQTANAVHTGAGLTLAEAGSNPSQLLYISLCFGFSLLVNAWTFFRISGGLFNPAVTFGLCLIGALDWIRGSLLIITQFFAGMAAAGIVNCMFPGPLNVSTTLSAGTTPAQGLFIEMFCTAQLVFTIFMLAAEKHRGTFMAPLGIGFSLFTAELTAVHYTGGSLNPARSFGPCVATGIFTDAHWIYWLGPTLGAVLAAGLYNLFKFLDYETANPGQDVESRKHAAEAKERSMKRTDSMVASPITAETHWTGDTANEITPAPATTTTTTTNTTTNTNTTTSECATCRARSKTSDLSGPRMSLALLTERANGAAPRTRRNVPAKPRPFQEFVAANPLGNVPLETSIGRFSFPYVVVTQPTPPVSAYGKQWDSISPSAANARRRAYNDERERANDIFTRTVSNKI